MSGEEMLILGAAEVDEVLAGRERDVLDAVEGAYLAHERGASSLPHSTFLRFPDDDVNRIIALPAYVGDRFDLAGVKWIASFPGNVARGMERASAVMVLNSCSTGRPEAILEGSIISARRTAASAALAARALLDEAGAGLAGPVGLVGTGLINREIVRFLGATLPTLDRLVVFDLDRDRAESFAESVRDVAADARVDVAASCEAVLGACPLVAFATTAGEPHVDDLSACPPGAILLHVSLRDLAPEVILAADNVVDDPDHVARARTSIHLAHERTGDLGFVRCTLARLLDGTAPAKDDPDRVSVFSPFGLGVLDLAVARLVMDGAAASGLGTRIPSFLPT